MGAWKYETVISRVEQDISLVGLFAYSWDIMVTTFLFIA